MSVLFALHCWHLTDVHAHSHSTFTSSCLVHRLSVHLVLGPRILVLTTGSSQGSRSLLLSDVRVNFCFENRANIVIPSDS